MKVKKFSPEDLQTLSLQAEQKFVGVNITDPDYANILMGSSVAYSLKNDDDITLASAGLFEEDHGRAYAWALISSDIGPSFIRLHKAIKNYLKTTRYRRIYMRVHTDFTAAILWADRLGFDCVGIERQYLFGADFARFSYLPYFQKRGV